jgi:asparagine synthase (glutamine-hydrolysing)
MARSGSLPPRERFIRDCVYLDKEDARRFVEPRLMEHLAAYEPHARHWERFNRVSNSDFLNQMLYLDLKIFMTSLNLTYNDRMSMASSVEVRVPFLDWQMAEWLVWNVSPAMKIKGNTTKYILRKAMSGILPDPVLHQPKAGFGAPVDHWLARDLREMVDDVLSEESLKKRGFFSPAAVREIVEGQRTGTSGWSASIWQFLTLELWLRTFVDRAQEDIAAAPMPNLNAHAVTYR